MGARSRGRRAHGARPVVTRAVVSGAAALLDLWETGLRLCPAARADLLLRAVGQESREWAVGRRDQALLSAYCAGPLAAVTDCPSCGTTVEIPLDAAALVAPSGAGHVDVEHLGHHVRVRLPTGADLLALPADADAGALLQRCVVSSSHDVHALRDAVLQAIDAALADADPAAELSLTLSCPDCDASWTEPLDPVRFAWATVESTARSLATDVHVLAGAYGWSEQEILAMSSFRRQLYRSAVDA